MTHYRYEENNSRSLKKLRKNIGRNYTFFIANKNMGTCQIAKVNKNTVTIDIPDFVASGLMAVKHIPIIGRKKRV